LDLDIPFKDQQRNRQIDWRKNNISIKESGIQNGREYAHIIPKRIWEENLWIGIRTELTKYLAEKGVQAHSGTHNLLSSWVSCANLYFLIRMDQEFRRLMLGFLQEKIDARITAIEHVRSENKVMGMIMDFLNPVVVRIMGPNINRRTDENVRKAGYSKVDVVDLHRSLIFKLLKAEK